MKLSKNIYKFFIRITIFFKNFLDHMVTWLKFYCLCNEFHNFNTKGIPFVTVFSSGKCGIRIGKNFRMNNGMAGNQIGFGKTPCIFQAVGGNIIIGNNVGMSQTAIIAAADVTIGDNVLLGGGVKIYTSDFHSQDYRLRRDRKKDEENKISLPVIINDDCFIGAGTIILKGVTIGPKSIVGAGSVVTKNVPPNEIWAGNPAKMIRKLEC